MGISKKAMALPPVKRRTSCNCVISNTASKVLIELRCFNPNYTPSGLLYSMDSEDDDDPIATGAPRPASTLGKKSKANFTWRVDPVTDDFDLMAGAQLTVKGQAGAVLFEVTVLQKEADSDAFVELATIGNSSNPAQAQASDSGPTPLHKRAAFRVRLRLPEDIEE